MFAIAEILQLNFEIGIFEIWNSLGIFVHKNLLFTFFEQDIKMNKQDKLIVETALDNLLENTGISGEWEGVRSQKSALDGRIQFEIEGKEISFFAEVKKELRPQSLDQIISLSKAYSPFMLIANNIFPSLKIKLRENKIGWLVVNGDIYFDTPGQKVWIETGKKVPILKSESFRAFSKSGLKVVFMFLCDNKLINKPYRELAELAEVSLGTIHHVMSGLKEQKYLLNQNADDLLLVNKSGLISDWVYEYSRKLKPGLLSGKFRFASNDSESAWRKMELKAGDTFWGGEPAGDLLTDYLRPETFTLYSGESLKEITRNYRLIPDEFGNVAVYQKFWADESDSIIVPPLLAYADLINHESNRCRETGQMIYEKFIEPNL